MDLGLKEGAGSLNGLLSQFGISLAGNTTDSLEIVIPQKDRLAEAKSVLLEAIDDYMLASERIRNDSSTEPTADEMFSFEPEDEQEEALFRQNLVELRSSLTENRTADLTLGEEEHLALNLNPFFNNTPDLRDMLPLFDQCETGIHGTMGNGLSNDPTLGGILPSMTHDEWGLEGGFCGVVTIPYLAGGLNVDGDLKDRTGIQPVFTDRAGNNKHDLPGTDIAELYLAKDDQYLYVAMTLHDGAANQDVMYWFVASERCDDHDTYGEMSTRAFYGGAEW